MELHGVVMSDAANNVVVFPVPTLEEAPSILTDYQDEPILVCFKGEASSSRLLFQDEKDL